MEFAELTYMPNAALDQFSHALMRKIVPVILICGISGIFCANSCSGWNVRPTAQGDRGGVTRRPKIGHDGKPTRIAAPATKE